MDVEGCKKRLYQTIDRDKEELFVLLGSLIQINSENFGTHGNEANCSDFIRRYCEELGYEAESYSPMDIPDFQIHPDYLAGRGLEGRRNCTVIVPGEKHDRKLMLAAHIDTVEIGDESKWAFPPLCGEVRDGNILGRGACDDKYAVATALFLIKKLKELEIKLPYDLLFSGYCDEEQGGSNGALATCLRYPCDDFLNMDCKNFEIWNCGVGGGSISFNVKSCESVDNCSKVLAGLNLVESHLRAFGDRRRAELENNPDFSGSIVARNALRVMGFSVGSRAGTDMGNGYLNITYYTDRQESEIKKEFATLKQNIDSEFKTMGLCELEIEKTTRFFHYIKSDENNRFVSLLQSVGAENGRTLQTTGACLSDLPMFILYGSPRAVSFGIGGDFHRAGGAHQTNEYVECDKLIEFAKIVGAFVLEYR